MTTPLPGSVPPLPLVDGALFISASFLETYAACPRAGQYYKLNARVSAEPKTALIFGNHVHSALEMHYRLQEFKLAPDVIRGRVADLLIKEFNSKPTEPDDWRQMNWALELYDQYVKKFEYDNIQLMRYTEPQVCRHCKGAYTATGNVVPCAWCNSTGKSNIMCEVPFALKLFTCDWTPAPIPVYYHGFIDLPCRRNLNQLFVDDFKTTSMLGQSFWDDKRMSAQQVGYAWAFNQLTGERVHGFNVRAIRTTQMPPGVASGKANKKGEVKTIERWWDEGITEQHFLLGDDELDEWKENTIQLVEQFIFHHSRNFFPQHKPTGCVHKYGKCQFFEVCNTFPVKDRPILLDSGLFKDKEASFEVERL